MLHDVPFFVDLDFRKDVRQRISAVNGGHFAPPCKIRRIQQPKVGRM